MAGKERVAPAQNRGWIAFRTWLFTVLFPVLVVPVALMVGKYLWIDGSRSPEFRYSITQTFGAAIGDGRGHRTVVDVQNTGAVDSEEHRVFLLYQVLGSVGALEGQEKFVVGTYFLNKRNQSIKTCVGVSMCKVVFGHLAVDGTMTLIFRSNTWLKDLPMLSYGGEIIKPTTCSGVGERWAQSCVTAE